MSKTTDERLTCLEEDSKSIKLTLLHLVTNCIPTITKDMGWIKGLLALLIPLTVTILTVLFLG